MESCFSCFTNDWLRIEFHINCRQSWLNKKRHQKKENEKAEDGYQAKEGRQIEKDIFP
jgi:hypothetical protein